MISLRESLEELVDASATQALAEGGTPGGRQALARVTLLLSLLERLEAGGASWWECGLMPAEVPLIDADVEGPGAQRLN